MKSSFVLSLSLTASYSYVIGAFFTSSLNDGPLTSSIARTASSSAFISSQKNIISTQRTTFLTRLQMSSMNGGSGSGGSGNFFRPIKRNKDDDEFDDDDDDQDEDDEEKSLYEEFASSEFMDNESSPSISSQISQTFSNTMSSKPIDWGGEYDTLRSRFDDVKNNKIGPSQTLFRIMTSQTPNEAIMSFINDASPQVVSAMSSTVTSLLGGLTMSSNPNTGMEMIVKANGEKLGSLCFQLQMTGYMFRNAEYVLAIRDLMNIQGQATMPDYKNAFDKLDKDGSGYIETDEIVALLMDVYGESEGDIPKYEVDAFLEFFDSNKDGKISWDEFERGLGVVADTKAKESRRMNRTTAKAALPGSVSGVEEEDDDDDDEEEEVEEESDDEVLEPNISGKVKIEMKNGRVIEVEAKEYIEELKKEAEALKAALRREKSSSGQDMANNMKMPPTMGGGLQPPGSNENDDIGIAGYIASLGGDLESLTKGISPEVVDAMKKLIDFVLDGGPSGRGKGRKSDKELEMELPGSALQQLALWQLVLGYKVREAEATGEYRKMLE